MTTQQPREWTLCYGEYEDPAWNGPLFDGTVRVIEKSAFDQLAAERDEWKNATMLEIAGRSHAEHEINSLKARLAEAETALRDCINGHDVKDYFVKNSNPTDKK